MRQSVRVLGFRRSALAWKLLAALGYHEIPPSPDGISWTTLDDKVPRWLALGGEHVEPNVFRELPELR